MRATALVTGGVCDPVLSAQIHEFDSVERYRPHVLVPLTSSGRRDGVRRVDPMPERSVEIAQVRCMPPDDTLRGLVPLVRPDHLEQVMEYGLRKKHVTPECLGEWSTQDQRVSRFVRDRGGLWIPPTESLLETRAVQLIREDPSIPAPTRQFVIYDRHGNFVARVDLCWPELGVFLELDGQGHKDQPVYDASRQTKVAAVTRWRCGRFTWDQVVYNPRPTLRDLRELVLDLAA